MKLILFCMNSEGSPYFASFKLAKQLVAADFKVIYVGFRFFESMVLLQDLEHLSIDDDQFVAENGSFVATDKQLNQVFCDFMEKWLTVNKPDLVIIDNIRLLEFSIPFHKHKIPVVGFGSNLSTSYNLKYPPVTSHRVNNSSIRWIAAMENFFEWVKLYANDWTTHLSKRLKLIHYRKRYGWDFEWGEYGYKIKVPNIIAMIPDFNLPSVRTSETDCFIGVAVDKERMDKRPLPLRRAPGKKLVYCSLGTHKYVKEKYIAGFFNAVIKAVEEREHLQLILHIREEYQRLIPDTSANKNIAILHWSPQLNVLSRSDLFITHGGLGSVRESLFLGVPMIVFPLAVDQPGNAARVVYHHLGLKGNIYRADARSMGDMIDRVIDDPSYSNAVRRMQQRCAEQENVEKGVRFINKILTDAIP
ncbi:MAG: glycosyltransferase family 1 protein [Chitinophagaceae bacterium]|nr:glycosyltransferase family 1 protein [Chitinophagaceae bacterium]